MAVTIGGNTPWQQEVAKASSYTVLNTDNGTLFTTTGASGTVTFTLPSLANGLGCTFWFLNTVGQTMAVTAPTNKLIVGPTATASVGVISTVTFSTANNLVGAFVRIDMNAAGTLYYATLQSTATPTMS